jgi:hypothetical protein
MTAPDPKQTPTVTPPEPPADTGTEPATEPAAGQPLTRLRGASVDVDVRKAAQLVVAACLVALAVTAVVLLIAGIQKNDQTDSLRQHGVPVEVRVTNCLGLMGGSGSNLAGYACSGTYTFAGHRYFESIPGSSFQQTGSLVRGVTVASDPHLLSTPALVASQRSSWHVFIAPLVLFVVLVVLSALVLIRRQHRRRGPEGPMTGPVGAR